MKNLHDKSFEATTITSADFDDDGKVDLIIGGIEWDIPHNTSTIKIHLFTIDNEKKTLIKKWSYEAYKDEICNLVQVSNTDINKDGKQDLIVQLNNTKKGKGELLAFLNDGNGKFEKIWQNKKDDIKFYFFNFKIADINQDGYDDIITRLNDDDKRQITFFMNNKDGTFSKKMFHIKENVIENTILYFDTGDFDSDGDIDIALSTEGDQENLMVAIYSNNNMLFEKVWEYNVLKVEDLQDNLFKYSDIYSIFASDFNNDGKSDFGVVTKHVRFNHLTKEENIRLEMQIFKNI